MKFCLSGRQPNTVLKKADEIKIELRDYRSLPMYLENFPEKTLILEFKNDIPKDFNWDEIKNYSDKLNGNFYCALSDLSIVNECKKRDLKFYYKYPVVSFFELEGLKNLGVSYLLIGEPLMFELKQVASYNIPLRAIPNLAYEPYIEHSNGIIGGWIRPEDIDKYGQYIDTFEFYAPRNLDKEYAMYKIYAVDKKWNGNLNLLIDNLDFDFDNRLLYDSENFADRRMNCGQKCLKGKKCRYCFEQMIFPFKVLSKYSNYKKDN